MILKILVLKNLINIENLNYLNLFNFNFLRLFIILEIKEN